LLFNSTKDLQYLELIEKNIIASGYDYHYLRRLFNFPREISTDMYQVKRKCGLEVGESYNKPKSEGVRQPQCTPEKEEAIMQALRHYGMI